MEAEKKFVLRFQNSLWNIGVGSNGNTEMSVLTHFPNTIKPRMNISLNKHESKTVK